MTPPARKSKTATYFPQVPLAHVKRAVASPGSAIAEPKNLIRERSPLGEKIATRTASVKRPRSR